MKLIIICFKYLDFQTSANKDITMTVKTQEPNISGQENDDDYGKCLSE